MAKISPEIVFVFIFAVLVICAINVNFTILSVLDRNSFEEPRFEFVPASVPTFRERRVGLEHNKGLPLMTAGAYSSTSVSDLSYRQSTVFRVPPKKVVPLGLRGGMKRHEPRHLGDSDRIFHHAVASSDRAKFLHDRLFKSAAIDEEGWMSPISPIAGGYSMAFFLGFPMQPFQLLVDTGSDLTWVQSRRCTECFDQPSDGYEADNSSTYQRLQCSSPICQSLDENSACATTSKSEQCDYIYAYGDQSTTKGRLSLESMTIGSTNGSTVRVPNFAFGVATDNMINFEGVDGIIGLGQGSISFPSQLGGDYGNKFSYCLQSYDDTAMASPIIFGEAAVPEAAKVPYSRRTAWPESDELIQYTPLKLSDSAMTSTFWFLNLQGLLINDKPVPWDVPESTRTIIDSGTTISMLDADFYGALKSSMIAAVQYPQVSARHTGLDLCFSTGVRREPKFPRLTFSFELADWELPMGNTFIPVDDEGTWCLSILASTLDGLQIFGNSQQANFQVIYDRPNARLGFVPAQCDSV